MRVLLYKKTGKPIEMQSHAKPGVLKKSAIKKGYKENEIEEREVNGKQWKMIKDKWIDKDVIKKIKKKQKNKQEAFKKLKDLGLTQDDLNALFN